MTEHRDGGTWWAGCWLDERGMRALAAIHTEAALAEEAWSLFDEMEKQDGRHQ